MSLLEATVPSDDVSSKSDCENRANEEMKIICLERHGGSWVSHVPSQGKCRYVFHPHTVWSSLARTDSDGFLAPC